MTEQTIPAALQPAVNTDHRTVQVPAFTIPLRMDDELLDPTKGARAAVVLDIDFTGEAEPKYRFRESTSIEGAMTVYLDDASLVYGSKVVSGSAVIQAYKAGPDVVEQPSLDLDDNQEALG